MTLNDTILQSIDQIAKKHSIKHNYVVTIDSNEANAVYNGNLVDVRLEAGNPPKMIIPFMFIMRCFMLEKKLPHIWKDRIQRAIEKYDRMRWTLSNPIDRDLALILRVTEKKWIRTHGITETGTPIFRDDEFDIEYVAIVTDRITKKSFSIAGTDPVKCKNEAKSRLTKIFMADRSLMDFRDQVLGMEDNIISTAPAEPKPKVVLIQTNVVNEKEPGEQVNVKHEY